MSDFPGHTLAYLATPFTLYRHGHERAARDAAILAARLLSAGLLVYSPIAYCFSLARAYKLNPLDLNLWLPIEERMCAACDVLIVAHLNGWDESAGIAREVGRFERARKPIYDLAPDTLAMTRRLMAEAAE